MLGNFSGYTLAQRFPNSIDFLLEQTEDKHREMLHIPFNLLGYGGKTSIGNETITIELSTSVNIQITNEPTKAINITL